MPRKREPIRGLWEREPGSDIWWIRYRAEGILKREKIYVLSLLPLPVPPSRPGQVQRAPGSSAMRSPRSSVICSQWFCSWFVSHSLTTASNRGMPMNDIPSGHCCDILLLQIGNR
jgi:hypothetical protein